MEQDGIATLIESARRGAGACLLISGAPGIGKTALAAEAAEAARAAGMLTLTARGTQLESDYALGVVRQLLERTVRELPAAEREELSKGAGEIAIAALGLARAREASAADGGFAVLHGLYWLVADLAVRRPVALIVDDVHWGDDLSVRWLAFLAQRVEELPVLVVITTRTAELAEDPVLAELELASASQVVRPLPLSAQACATIVELALGSQPEPEFTSACHQVTGGNPLLLRELLAFLAGEGVAPTAAAVEQLESLGPQAVVGYVKRTLLRLPEPAKELARAAAVFGPGAELGHAAELAGLDRHDAADAADLLVGEGLLSSADRLEFVHPLIQAAVYERIPTGKRKLAHASAAQILSSHHAPAEAIAAQLLQVDALGDRWVIERLIEAAEQARARGVPAVAVRYLSRALREPGMARDPELLLALGTAEARAGEPEAIERLRTAFECAHGEGRWLPALREYSLACRRLGRFNDVVAAFEQAREQHAEDDPSLALLLDAGILIGAFSDVMTPAAAPRAATLRDTLEGDVEAPGVVFAVLASWVASSGEPADAAVPWIDAALGLGGSRPVEPSTLPFVALPLILTEDFERAIRLTTDSIDACTAEGDIPSVSASLTWRACVHYRCGDIPAAETDARVAVETARKFARGIYTLFSAAALAEVLIERGELGAATGVLEEAGDPGDAEGMLFNLFLIHARGRLLSARGEYENAAICLREVAKRSQQAGWRSPALACWRSDLALALVALGEREEALALAREELELARGFGRPRAVGVALRAQGLVESGERAVSLLAEAVVVLERSAARLEYARALVDLGGALRRVNQRALARERLSEGARVATRCGASALAERAHQELIVAGARPRRFGPELRDQLTASERRVADLAASGMTNREIAQALFVTMRTVETHLSHVYSKLDINSREHLPRALAAAVR